MEVRANGTLGGEQQLQKQWTAPHSTAEQWAGGLKVNNTLSDTKVPFTTKNGSRNVTWYNCGPTVYDSAHVGHARNYLTFDIIRRILEDYFGYNVFYVMNVTDVDDKIIKRARRNHLLDRYRAAASDPKKVGEEMLVAIEAEICKQKKEVEEAAEQLEKSTSSHQRKEFAERLKQEEMKLSSVEKGKGAVEVKMKEATTLGGLDGVNLLLSESASDALASQLDDKVGDTVTDHAIFRAHSSRYEKEFFEDMKNLGIRPPDIVTRVTEYIDVIIRYVEKIIERGFAYHSNGSVYFDTKAFIDAGHTYGKLKPWAVGNAGLAGESEANFENMTKKCPSDFALWKVSKRGEPSWPSPWGLGRPGWHIECSAMASDVIGSNIDVHSGGNDLQFPHHDNELAQAEAYHGCHQWVNYFLHSGHLAINGLKMSKSLKNFITIRQALVTYSARQLRLLFVSQAWDKPMTFSDAAMETTLGREKKLDAFFDSVRSILRQSRVDDNSRWSDDEKNLNAGLEDAMIKVKDRLEENFDTAGALEILLNLIKDTKLYCEKRMQSNESPKVGLVTRVATYVTKLLTVFGLSSATAGDIGWGPSSNVGTGQSTEEVVAPYLDALVSFKDEVRGAALELPQGASKNKLLALGDKFRDQTMAEIGVRLEDRFSKCDAGWKIVDPLVLKNEKEEKLRRALKENLAKLETLRDRQVKDLAKWEAAGKDPKDLFKGRIQDFSAFADDGIPTHDSKGVELTSSAKKKFKKEMDAAAKVADSLRQKLSKDPKFIESLKSDIRETERRVEELSM